mgnify:CR=1 FL=1
MVPIQAGEDDTFMDLLGIASLFDGSDSNSAMVTAIIASFLLGARILLIYLYPFRWILLLSQELPLTAIIIFAITMKGRIGLLSDERPHKTRIIENPITYKPAATAQRGPRKSPDQEYPVSATIKRFFSG